MPRYRSVKRIKFANDRDAAFQAALRAEVAAWFARTGRGPIAGPGVWLKGGLLAAAAIGSYGALLTQPWGTAGLLAAAVTAKLALLFLVLNIGHDAAHRAVTGDRATDDRICWWLFAFLGVDGTMWQLRHLKSHHNFPNVDGCDADIDHNPLLRLSPGAPTRRWQRWQHLYAWPAYALVGFHSVFVQDVVYLRQRSLANLGEIRHAPREVLQLAAGKAIHLTAFVLVPWSVLDRPLWHVLVGYAVASSLQSFAFILPLVATHFAAETEFPQPGPARALARSWAGHALATALDFAPRSRLASWLYGGINCHAAHHLLPQVSHAHYRRLTPLIARAAAAHGLPYNSASFMGALASHFRFLKRMGRAAPVPAAC
ncbi:MAG: acyl-CoA desaturase [Alphaproteobacteria bacterium]|nr:acyl-CoA desaturase [Alphaproteobacteria bacterium]